MFDHETYLSPFTWRYGSVEMRHIWSEHHRRRLWRRIWVTLAEAQSVYGLVTRDQVADLQAHANKVDVGRAHQIEAEIEHDLVSEVRAFAEQCTVGGSIIHLGATSMDIKDNADVLRLRDALDLIVTKLQSLLSLLASQVTDRADQVCMGYTHLQPAEPTTIGYRLAQYGLDLLIDLAELQRARDGLRGKGFKGATGTSASYTQLMAGLPGKPSAADLESRIMARLGLEAFPVTNQTYPRKQDWLVVNALAGLAGSLYKLAFDLRILQAQPYGEWGEPFGSRQVGSSTMAFKRNPVNSETMNSLARLVASLPHVAWDNAAHSLLERTLDDSANRRLILPQAFLACDELLIRAHHLMSGLVVHETSVRFHLERYGAFAATERLLMELVKAGADRQAMHEVIRRRSMEAWEAIQRGGSNPLVHLLISDPELLRWLPADQIRVLLDASSYIGDAPQRARHLAQRIRETVS